MLLSDAIMEFHDRINFMKTDLLQEYESFLLVHPTHHIEASV